MFQFTWFPLPVLCVHTGVIPLYRYQVSPFGHPRIKAQSAAPRGLSQPLTSFIGRRHQGIHRWLFVAWKIRTSKNSNFDQMLVLAMQFSMSTGGCGQLIKLPDRASSVKTRSLKTEERTKETSASTGSVRT